MSVFGNGQDVIDTGGAISRLGFKPTMNSGTVAESREMASQAHRQARSFENAAQEILTSTHNDGSAFGTSSERSRGFETGCGRSANTNVEQFDRTTGSSTQGMEERSTIGQSQRVTQTHDRSASVFNQVAGSPSGSIAGDGSGGGASSGRAF